MMSLSVSTLVREAEQLDNRSLDAFIATVISVRVRRQTSDKQKNEARLLRKINKSLPLEQVERFRALNQKRIENTLSEQEYSELTNLLEKVEKLNVGRLSYLTTLARLRGVSVRELMKQLDIVGSLNG